MSKPEDKAEDIDSDEDVPALEKADTEAKPAEPVEDTTLANSDVTTKYQEASKIVQGALAEVASKVIYIDNFVEFNILLSGFFSKL